MMEPSCLHNLVLDDQRAVGQQITEFLRALIQCGALKAGQRLPGHQELAELWSVKPSTVHHALQPLVREGMLSRRPRVGTYVKEVVRCVKRVAIYLDADVWHEGVGSATRAVVRGLNRELEQRGIQSQVYISSSPVHCPENQRQISDQLIQDCKSGKVQAILAPLVSSVTTKQILALKVPFSLCGNGEYPGAVNPSCRQFVDKGLVQLQRMGCRRVGLISSTCRQMSEDNHWRLLHENFQQRVEELRLHVDPRWVVMPQNDTVREDEARQFGFVGFKHIWELDTKPDGLLIYTDQVARGVIDFVKQARIDVPNDIKFVMHVNRHQPLNVPFAVSCLSYDLLKVAQAMVESIGRQFDGQPAAPLVQGYDLTHEQPVQLRLVDQINDIDLDYPLMAGA